MEQSRYEDKKRLLKRIKNEYGARLESIRMDLVGPKAQHRTTLAYSTLVGLYFDSKFRLQRFINRSLAYKEIPHGKSR